MWLRKNAGGMVAGILLSLLSFLVVSWGIGINTKLEAESKRISNIEQFLQKITAAPEVKTNAQAEAPGNPKASH